MLRGNRLWHLGVAEEPGLGPGAARRAHRAHRRPFRARAVGPAPRPAQAAPLGGDGRRVRVRVRPRWASASAETPPGRQLRRPSALGLTWGGKATLPRTFPEVAGHPVT